MIVVLQKKLHETQRSQSKFHELNIYYYHYVCVGGLLFHVNIFTESEQ